MKDQMTHAEAVSLLAEKEEEIERLTKHKIKFEDANNICSDDEILFTKRKILVRNIVDYIAGMTDSYAMNEFNKIKG